MSTTLLLEATSMSLRFFPSDECNSYVGKTDDDDLSDAA